MLLTKKSHDVQRSTVHGAGSARFVQSLSRGLSNALPTMDRRAFLRRSGLGVGVGLAATQLALVKKAKAAGSEAVGDGSGKLVVKRTVCSHCSVGCAVDAVVENGIWVRQEPVFDGFIIAPNHRFKRRDHIADDIFGRVMQQGCQTIGLWKACLHRDKNSLYQHRMLRHRENGRPNGLTIPSRHSSQSVRNILDFDIEWRRIKQVQPTARQHPLPSPWRSCSKRWHQRLRSNSLTSS
jgi:hypothetical protein